MLEANEALGHSIAGTGFALLEDVDPRSPQYSPIIDLNPFPWGNVT